MRRGRDLKVGDFALTDFNGPGRLTRVKIVERSLGQCQSGIMFRVEPFLKHGTSDSWYCADWFEPAPAEASE